MSIWEEVEVDPERGAASLVAAYADRLYRTAYRLCSNAATSEDLVFRTLTRAVTASGRAFADERAYFSWLCTILVNFHRQDLRLKGHNALVFSDTLPEVEADAPDPGEALSIRADHEAIREAVASLTPLLRETAVLRYYDDLSVPEIAEVQGVPEGTVKFRLHEARRKVRQILTQRFAL